MLEYEVMENDVLYAFDMSHLSFYFQTVSRRDALQIHKSIIILDVRFQTFSFLSICQITSFYTKCCLSMFSGSDN